MDIGSLFLIIALLVLVALFVSRPLMEKENISDQVNSVQSDHQLSAALAERDQILNALHELDLDYALGKIPSEDYPVERAAMLDKGAQVLIVLDQFQNKPIGSDVLTNDLAPVIGLQSLKLQQASSGETSSTDPNGSTAPTNGSRNAVRSPTMAGIDAGDGRTCSSGEAADSVNCGHAVQKTDHFV
jgi:hypothetical protein